MNKPINFELAKLLKEKGVDFASQKAYLYRHDGHKLDSYKGILIDAPLPCDIEAPTIAETVMWLYEKHGIWICVDVINSLFKYMILSKEKSPNQLWQSSFDFDLPTKAYEAAILYCLKNLI